MTELPFFLSAGLIWLFHPASVLKLLLSWRESSWQRKRKCYSTGNWGVTILSTRISKQAPWKQRICSELKDKMRSKIQVALILRDPYFFATCFWSHLCNLVLILPKLFPISGVYPLFHIFFKFLNNKWCNAQGRFTEHSTTELQLWRFFRKATLVGNHSRNLQLPILTYLV